ncbi:B2 bradykinin receptor isoform X1 [Etheostoma spectabile]|uniref:B2 bradykinin receptor n=1 Tax=Etheostoma spectabile TaxID=54343 RepID=A0A5J5CNV2_9PERO|nr:B2 bradykinin receptor-like isoform X1 [Etheostoma spectabile]KAA8582070.1 hypothetical protein FQN60_008810 [Etheostoma spectabile]
MDILPTSNSANFSTVSTLGDQSNTTNKCPPAEFKDWHSSVVPACMLLTSVLGIVMNLFVLMVFCFHKKACTVAEIYLSNLAAADLFLMVCLPLWAANAINRYDWPFAHHLCSLFPLPINMNAYCSIYFLVLISIDRYIALVHPLSHKGISRPKFAKLGCLLVWGFGLLLSIPTLVYRKVAYFSRYNKSLCFLNYSVKEQLLFDGIQNTFGFIIPICMISYCTLIIIHSLNNRLIERSKSQKMEQKATTLVLVVLLVFVICWVPHHVVLILTTLIKAGVLRECSIIANVQICSTVFMNLAFFNSVLNPILYVVVGKNFRKKVRGLFKQWSIDRTMTIRNTSTVLSRFRSVKPTFTTEENTI